MFSSFFGAVIASPLARRLAMFAAIALVLLGLGSWLRLEMAWRHAAEERAEAAEAAVAARDRSIAALEEAMAEAERRRSRLEPIRRAVNAAPITNACVASPAIRAVIDGLRAAPNAGAGNSAAMPRPAGR
jgi:FAD/FMN-containing dehydrogenase